jgi:hypothetical protein
VRSVPRQLTPLERRAHNEVRARAASIHLDDLTNETVSPDEILGHGQGTEFSHRVRASQGGTYRPANGIWLSHSVHAWLDEHRDLAVAGGWQLLAHQVPQDAPMWLALPWPGWWVAEDRAPDGPHILVWADDQPPRPRLPFEPRAAYDRFTDGLALIPA